MAVSVVRQPTLKETRFLAFGDSITAGEVTVPTTTTTLDVPPVLKLVVVPGASYPSQLLTRLQARYTVQAAQLAMVNAGKPGESVVESVPRLGQLLANGQHEVLLLLDGYNDLLAAGSAAIPRVSRALADMARDARARGLQVYLAELTPPIPGRKPVRAVAVLINRTAGSLDDNAQGDIAPRASVAGFFYLTSKLCGCAVGCHFSPFQSGSFAFLYQPANPAS